jgi:uncharacterized membrane protein YphA (DoxX/SURF4 family)
MRTTKIIYWVLTGFVGLMMFFSGVMNTINGPDSVELFRHLGYPPYLPPFLGIAKALGAIAILVPGFPRIKEWAYAGFLFDLSGAVYSGLSVGDPIVMWIPVFVGILLLAGSYIYYHKLLKATAESK